MNKYSKEFKLKVVKEYINTNLSYKDLSKKYSIPSRDKIYQWVCAYRRLGEKVFLSTSKSPYPDSLKMACVNLYLTGKHSAMDVANKYGISTEATVIGWVHKYMENNPNEERVYRRVCKTTRKRTRKSKDTNSNFKRFEETAFREGNSEEKARIISSFRGSYKLKDLLETTGYPKSTYMYWQKRFDRENQDAEMEQKILEIRNKNKDYGYRRIYGELKKEIKINIKKVRRIYKKLNLQVTSFTRKTRKYNSYRGTIGRISPNRIRRRFFTSIPHQKITTDTTEFKYYLIRKDGKKTVEKLYLDPFMDMYNSEILSYSISDRPSANAILQAQEKAIEVTADCSYRRTFHSDQGWAYQMKKYQANLIEGKIFQSMSRKGNCLDNSIMENFFGLLKQEIYYGVEYNSYEALKNAIEQFIKYYNEDRIKSKLNWMSPIQFRLINEAA